MCVCACVCVGAKGWTTQGLVPAWIKSRWRPWQGRKPPVLTFSCSIQPSLLYFQWQHGMCDRDSLDLYSNALSCIRQKGNKSVCSVVHAISFHEVIKQVMGTRQSWPPITWKDLNDPFAMITEWIVLLETLIKVKWWWAQTSTGLIYKYTFIIPSEWHKFRIILAIALWVFYRHKGSKNKQIIIK